MGWLKKENLLLDHKKTSKCQDRKVKEIYLEKNKCTTKQMKNTWNEIGVSVCDRSVKNSLNKKGFTQRKTKRKPALRHKQKKIRYQ